MTRAIDLWKKEEYSYPCAGDFLPNITAYLHDDGEIYRRSFEEEDQWNP